MEKRTDSWHHLQDHATLPPPEVFGKLRDLLDPAAAAFNKLGDHSILPPIHLRSAITAKVASTGRRRKILLWYASAAACILLFTIGYVVYRTGTPHDASIVKNGRPTRQSIAPTDTLSHSLATTDSEKTAVAAANTPDSAHTSAIALLPIALSVDGEPFMLTDNSPLATFTSYHYPALGKKMNGRKDQTSLHIHLDQYTNISLSPAMTATLRELYETRSDGTPAKKARRTRERLGKWDAEDKKEFDLHYTTNPLDPVDLAEFLFPPLFSFSRHSGSILPPATTPASTAGTTTPASTAGTAPAAAAHPDSPAGKTLIRPAPLTVSYTLTLVTKKMNAGIGETYNGAVQTLFDAGDHARLRLASLMRIQSIFVTPDTPFMTILTESAKPRNSVALTSGQWARYNDKYVGMTRDFKDDTTVILGYACKKALITLHDGRRISAWYTPRIQSQAQTRLEPAFAGVPGLVLCYEYTCRRKTVRYRATSLSRQPIDPAVFSPPPRR